MKQRLTPLADFLSGIGKRARRDPLSTGLLVGAVALGILFFALLGSIGPKSADR